MNALKVLVKKANQKSFFFLKKFIMVGKSILSICCGINLKIFIFLLTIIEIIEHTLYAYGFSVAEGLKGKNMIKVLIKNS